MSDTKTPAQTRVDRREFLLVDVPFTEEGRSLIKYLEQTLKTEELPFFRNAQAAHSGAGEHHVAKEEPAPGFSARLVTPGSDAAQPASASPAGSGGDDGGQALLMLVRQQGWPPPTP